jgi:hypothetical protein
VEAEIGIIEHYAGPAATLEEAIPLLRGLGLELFDLRTNRSPGNAARLKPGTVTNLLQCQRNAPALAQRLNEVDAIFFRDPRTFIDQGASSDDVRRLIAMLCAYNFFGEAVFAASHAERKGVIDSASRDALFSMMKSLYDEARLEVVEWETWLAAHDWQHWGQYMWVPYPCA